MHSINYDEVGDVDFIKLHVPTSSAKKLRLMKRDGQFTYNPTLHLKLRKPLKWRLSQASDIE
jgi:hypothetical protein